MAYNESYFPFKQLENFQPGCILTSHTVARIGPGSIMTLAFDHFLFLYCIYGFDLHKSGKKAKNTQSKKYIIPLTTITAIIKQKSLKQSKIHLYEDQIISYIFKVKRMVKEARKNPKFIQFQNCILEC